MRLATVCSGIGSPEQAMSELSKELGFRYTNVFACEIDKFPRASFEAMHNCGTMYQDMTKELWDQPSQYADLFIGGIPCQSFSLAGKRLGEKDKRGVLFYDFYRYVKNHRPKVFIIENVKGLLSDSKGRTFNNWCSLLGSIVNNRINMFQHPDCLGYRIYHTVLNTKDFGLPQNRERVFVVGIRPDIDFEFEFPNGWPLQLRLKDMLEAEVDEKYYLSQKMLKYLNVRSGRYLPPNIRNVDGIASCITVGNEGKSGSDMNLISEPLTLAGNTITNTITNTVRTGGKGSLTEKHSWDVIIEPIGGRITGRNPINPNSRIAGQFQVQTLELNENNFITNVLSTVQKDNVVIEPTVRQINASIESGGRQPYKQNRIYDGDGLSPVFHTECGRPYYTLEDTEKGYLILNGVLCRIRRLTPLECWRLQGFPDEQFYKAKTVTSDTQLYKQAGNSISTTVIKSIIKKLLPILY